MINWPGLNLPPKGVRLVKWMCDFLPPLNLWNFPEWRYIMPNIDDCRQYEKEMEQAFSNDVPAAKYAGWCLGVNYSPPNLPPVQEPIEDLVAKDLKDRARWGIQKYGHALHESMDDMIQHLYEELLDGASYIKAYQVQQKKK